VVETVLGLLLELQEVAGVVAGQVRKEGLQQVIKVA
jgi:hypothetical protein